MSDISVPITENSINIDTSPASVDIDIKQSVVNVEVSSSSVDIDIKNSVINVEISGGGGANESYTGTATVSVGGITATDAFVGASMTEMWDALISPALYPSFTNPSSTFTDNISTYQELSASVSGTFTTNFSRGSISPQYSAATPYRSGDAVSYTYTGAQIAGTYADATTQNQQTLTSYTIVAGTQSWTSYVTFSEGPQPTDSNGDNYDSPYAAGNTSTDTINIIGVLPVYATTSAIGTMTKQSLQSNGSVFTVTVVAESGGDKQTVDFPNDAALAWGSISTLEEYNELSGTWETINLSTFTSSATTQTVQSVSRDYTRYTHNGTTTGARQLRWTV